MKTIFKARDLPEAYLVKGLLEQRGVSTALSGEYLAGGVGELPATDLLRLRVAEEDAERASQIIADYERGAERISDAELEALAVGDNGGAAPPNSAGRRHPGWPLFLAIVVLLLVIALIGVR